ncbi:MAG: glycosyltransferase family 2 protein [bacterium]|nr:glycosyltransferase family 2 protein [bacterium]
MDLCIVIVSWNVRERLRTCLESIAAHAGNLTHEVVVVDNASSDGSAEMVRDAFPRVRCIGNDTNRGFAAACNQGIAAAHDAAFVLLLNPDMRVLPGALPDMVAFMQEERNARVGVAGCRLLDEHGAVLPHVRRFPELADQLALLMKVPHVFPRVLDRYLVRDFDYAREARVDSLRGSFFCIRRRVIDDIGLLDDHFFLWFEEVDFCKRAHDAGWEIAYTPRVSCVDAVGRSFAQVRRSAKQRIFTQSMVRYFGKHHAPWKRAVLAFVRPFAIGTTRIADLWQRSPSNS